MADMGMTLIRRKVDHGRRLLTDYTDSSRSLLVRLLTQGISGISVRDAGSDRQHPMKTARGIEDLTVGSVDSPGTGLLIERYSKNNDAQVGSGCQLSSNRMGLRCSMAVASCIF